MSAMECPGPMDLHCADVWRAPRARRAARRNADETTAARRKDDGKQEHRMEEIVSDGPMDGHSKNGRAKTDGSLRGNGGALAALD
jgi:hypothetical protein